ncbi:MAG: response regulator transcription factor [Elusimicrobia bacterium]|nr:response regulator transcription factor [Elusimicrobiota bacterium]
MIKVLIADDHAIVRRGLKQILAEDPGVSVFGEASNAAETLEKVRQETWDVLILDITLPDASGLDVLKQLKCEKPKLPVLVLSMHSEDQYAVRVLKAGASGFMNKESAPEQLLEAIKKVLKGGKYVSPTLAEKLASELGGESSALPHMILSDREYHVLCRIASGKTVMEIAQEMSLSVKTISTYRARILEKMSMKTNAELTRYALQNKLVL